MNERDPLLAEREKTHGSFRDNSDIWLSLGRVTEDYQRRLTNPQRLALVMIYLKIARMIQQPQIKDHWDDIAGYAKLGSEACE